MNMSCSWCNNCAELKTSKKNLNFNSEISRIINDCHIYARRNAAFNYYISEIPSDSPPFGGNFYFGAVELRPEPNGHVVQLAVNTGPSGSFQFDVIQVSEPNAYVALHFDFQGTLIDLVVLY